MKFFYKHLLFSLFGLQFIDGLIAGLGALLGNVTSGLFGSSAQDSANETNVQLARENRDWMQNMSNTSVQRNVRDLRDAGLNPLLAAGGGASTPSTSAAEVAASNPASGMGGMGSAIQSAMEVEKTKTAVELADKQKENIKADTVKKVTDNQLSHAVRMTEFEKAKQTAASAREVELRAQLLKDTNPSKASQEKYKGEQAEYDRSMMKYDNIIKRAQSAVNVGSSAMDMASPIGKAVKTVKEAKSKAELMKELNRAYKRSN